MLTKTQTDQSAQPVLQISDLLCNEAYTKKNKLILLITHWICIHNDFFVQLLFREQNKPLQNKIWRWDMLSNFNDEPEMDW